MSHKNMNSRYKILINLSTFKFIMITTYVTCFVILLIIIKIISHVFFVYKSFAEGIFVIKFNVTV